jgi:hypothetical protein
MTASALRTFDSLAAESAPNSAAGEVSVRVLRTIGDLENLRTAWTEMQRHPNADLDLFLTVLASNTQIDRPYVVVLYRDGSPNTILVGRLENTRLDLRVGYAGFLKPRARSLTFIYGGLFGNTCADNCRALAVEIMNSLRGGEADFAFFNHLPADSSLYEALGRAPGFLGRDHFPALQTHRSMALPGSAEEFLQGLSPKLRRNQRWKKLLRDYPGAVSIRCFRDASELEQMISDVEVVAKTTYQRGLGVGFADDEITRGHLVLKARRGWLRTYVLYVADRPWAFWSGTLYRDVFHSDYMGYNPEHSKYSPGLYLVTRVIEDFCKSGEQRKVDAVDFGLGDAEYKETLCNVQWQDASTYVFAPTARGLLLNAIRTPILLFDRFTKRALERTGLLAKMKRLWRNQVALKPPAGLAGEAEAAARVPPPSQDRTSVTAR